MTGSVERLERLDEAVHRTRMACGLEVLVLPKPGFTKKFATFATRYGSIDRRFRTPAGEELQVPDGIAHFLEHQMFAKEYGDAFERFSALGASANAFTSYTNTTYLFSAAGRFEEAFDLLLDFVQEPYFKPAGINKERGIIEQELRMYEDSPQWRLYQQLRECLYAKHPFRVDIGGTVASIAEIDADLLNRCYDTFYHPSNMVVSVVGDVSPEDVVARVAASLERHGGYQPRGDIERLFPEEPAGVHQAQARASMAVARPMFALGYKDPEAAGLGLNLVRQQLEMDVLLDVALGKSSGLYNRLYEQGLIDSGFGAQYMGDASFGMTVVAGETDDPARLETELRDGLAAFAATGMTRGDFARAQHRIYGEFVGGFDSPELLSHALNQAYFEGVTLKQYLDCIEALSEDAVMARARRHLVPEAAAVSVVVPSQ